MYRSDLWKYCTTEQWKEMLLSFDLLGHNGWPDEKVIACLYAVSNHTERHYCPADVLKKDGTVRHVLAPDPLLKGIQRNILLHILNGLEVSPYAFAYHKGAGIVENASVHLGKAKLLKLDIKDFFGSILFPMIKGTVFSERYFPPQVGTLLTYLCCYHDYLPQGAPTSAAISNRIMRSFDLYMGSWCGEKGITYSRYCDDMTFSGDFDADKVRRKVDGYLRSMGFSLNHSKTEVILQSGRQKVTGIVVNEKLQTNKNYRRKLRQEVYYCEKYGAASHYSRIGKKGEKEVYEYLRILLGKVNFILYVNPEDTYFKDAGEKIKKMMAEQLLQMRNGGAHGD